MATLVYYLFGTSLVLTLLWIIVHYYAGRRRERIEAPKHRMLEDDDD